MTTTRLCLGIDPNPNIKSFQHFCKALDCHREVLATVMSDIKTIKPNLAFFLRYGAQGLAALEKFCDEFREAYEIILDGKFNEISNSLSAYLDFTFDVLGVSGVTINPFLGEKTIEQTLQKATQAANSRARVYVLCSTSEASSESLSELQRSPQNIVNACINVSNKLNCAQNCLGLVIGANRHELLRSDLLLGSNLSILSPGLGAQGASYEIIDQVKQNQSECEFTFPLSRGIFQGGNVSPNIAIEALGAVLSLFKT